MMPYLAIGLFAFVINIPCGFIRAGCPKFTVPWYFWASASIPFLIYFRMTMDLNDLALPVVLFLAVLGQRLGVNYRKKTMTDETWRKFKQIPDLNIPSPQKIEEKDVLIALLNMGGPRTNDDVHDFQKHLFADPLLIRFPLSFLLQDFFAWLLITVRLKAVKARYMQIGGGSPIYKSTIAQTEAVKAELKRRGRNIDVVYSFNYSPPFPTETIEDAKKLNKKALMPLSLYPHYSQATTGSNIHYLKKAAQKNYPQLQFIQSPSYYIHDGYIQAFIDRINEAIKPSESLDDFYLIFSAHGLPEYFLNEGDPYAFQINQTVTKIVTKLNRDRNWIISYQSAVGPLQWLKPSTEDILEFLHTDGVRKLLMVPISFVGDHIETIHEIDIEYREIAKEIGFTDYRMSKAIETHAGFIEALVDSIEEVLPNKEKPLYRERTRHEHSV